MQGPLYDIVCCPTASAMVTHILLSRFTSCLGQPILVGTIRRMGSGEGDRAGIALEHLSKYFLPFSFKNRNRRTTPLVGHLTLDDESAVLIPGVLHGVESLFGDAVQVHIPPVFQHLERDVCTVDHCSRCL